MTNSRRKGAVHERKAAILWQRWFPDCKRWFPRQQQGVKAPDIGSDKMNQEYYVEVKAHKRITDTSIRRLYDKTVNDLMDWQKEFDVDSIPILMFRENYQGWHTAIEGPYFTSQFVDEVTVDGDGYQLGDLLIIPWATFEAALDKIHKETP